MKIFRFMLVAGLLWPMPVLADRAGLSGAAMMRVEVEVYKGPVGQSPEIQIGELSSLLAQSVKAMNGWQTQALGLRQTYCVPRNDKSSHDCSILNQAIEGAADVASDICKIGPYRLATETVRPQIVEQYITNGVRAADQTSTETSTKVVVSNQTNPGDGCAQYRKPSAQGVSDVLPYLADTQRGAAPTIEDILNDYADYNRRISVAASEMRLVAHRLGAAQVGFVPKERKVRYAIASLNFQLTEIANSIASRNLVLQRLLDVCAKGLTAADAKNLSGLCRQPSRKLPTSDYLRDVEPSRYMDAFKWFNAALPSTGTGAFKLEDRTRAMLSLTEDYYWEKVNEVYASGQGDVSMAFIKDELGNWNLKSYSNDPSRLLAAYRGVANAAISAATQLARRAVGDPTALANSNRALDLADRLATGQSPGVGNIGGLRIRDLRQRVIERLEKAQFRFADRQSVLLGPLSGNTRSGGTIDSLAKTLVTKIAEAESARNSLVSSEQTKLAAQSALARCSEAGNCADEASSLTTAVTSVISTRADYANAYGAQRKAEDELAVAKAEAEHLGDRAAELADEILQEYQRDLSILQQVAATGGQGGAK